MDIQEINIVKKHHVEEFAQELAYVPWLHLPSNPRCKDCRQLIYAKKEGGKLTIRSLIEWNDASKG